MFERGDRIDFGYPVVNSVDTDLSFKLRRVEIVGVRDLVTNPLTPQEFIRRPYLRRSRWLVTAVERDTGCFRKFYLGASVEFQSPGVLRIGLYVPGETKPRRLLGQQFAPTASDRRKLLGILQLLSEQEIADLQIRVLADDLRLVF